MDILQSSFVSKHIELFDNYQLSELDKFLNFEDEVLNYYQNNISKKDIIKTKFRDFKRFKL